MLSVVEFAHKAGFEDLPAAGQVGFHYSIGEKEGSSYTIKFDNRDPAHPKIETIAGLTGKALEARELHNYAVWLQATNAVELKVHNDNVTDVRGKLLGKDVAGEEIIDKVAGFFGALVERAIGKAHELALTAAKITKEVLPTLGRIPFASELTGRSLAFAKAAGGKIAPKAAPAVGLTAGPKAPGLGGGAAQRVTRAHQEEETD